MLKEFLNLFRSDDVVARMGEDFGRMLDLSYDLTLRAGRVFFDLPMGTDEHEQIARADVAINKLERHIRKQVVTHLTLSTDSQNVTYCLLLMSLVKDVERLGDYATNVAEVYNEGGGPLPDDENGKELREIRRLTEDAFGAVHEVFATSDSERAVDLIEQGRDVSKRCDALICRVASSSYDAATTTSLVLGARYYKRIGSHLLNVLSGVVMPLHKLDYFDESALESEA